MIWRQQMRRDGHPARELPKNKPNRFPWCRADQTLECNAFEGLVAGYCKLPFPGSLIEFVFDPLNLCIGEGTQIATLWEVLAHQIAEGPVAALRTAHLVR
jgi:hypothetical protein